MIIDSIVKGTLLHKLAASQTGSNLEVICEYTYVCHIRFLMNEQTHHIYTDKLRISVIDLTKINLATEEDRHYQIDTWAQLFKASTWEEVKELATQKPILAEAGETIYEVSQEEHQRQILEGREDARRQELGVQRLIERTKKERDEAEKERAKAEKERDDALAQCDALYALLREKGINPAEAISAQRNDQ